MSRVLKLAGNYSEHQSSRDRTAFPGVGTTSVGLVSYGTIGSFDVTIFGRNLPRVGDFVNSTGSVAITGVTTTGSIDGGLTYLTRITHAPSAQKSIGNAAYFTGARRQIISGLAQLTVTGATTIQVMCPVNFGTTVGKVITCFGPTGSGIEFRGVVTTAFLETAESWASSYQVDLVSSYYNVAVHTPVQRAYSGLCSFVLTEPQDLTFTSRRVAPNAPRFG